MSQEEEMDYSNTSEELNGWFGLATPTFMLSILGIYLILIWKVVPEYMKNRKPYQLKTFIAVYNILQVLACIYIVVTILKITSTKLFKFWLCTLFEQNSRAEYQFNRISYFTFWLKIVELSETIIFVLRKKRNQVTFLHVFHHCSTVTLIFVLLHYYRGGAALYPLFLNSNVHIIMYSYYLVAALADKRIVRRLLPIKKSITTIQMIQFALILLQAFTSMKFCNISPWLIAYYSSVVTIIFYGFYDFYKKSYTKPSGAHKATTTHKKSAAATGRR